jgi:hypothetical protein
MRRGRGVWRPSLNETGYFHLYVAPKFGCITMMQSRPRFALPRLSGEA